MNKGRKGRSKRASRESERARLKEEIVLQDKARKRRDLGAAK